jgi:hypothetical protein
MTYSEHVHQYQTSNKSKQAYCKDHNVNYPSFLYHYRKTLKTSTPSFIPLSFSALSQIEIQYPSGVKIILSQDIPVAYIKSLIV